MTYLMRPSGRSLFRRGQPLNPQNSSPPIQTTEVNPFPHPPFIIPLLMLLAHLDYVPAFVIWSVLMSIIFIISATHSRPVGSAGAGTGQVGLVLGNGLILPGFLQYPQWTGHGFIAPRRINVGVWLVPGAATRLSGIGLALTLIRPHMAVMLGAPFSFQAEQGLVGFCAGAGVLVLVSVLLLGRTGR